MSEIVIQGLTKSYNDFPVFNNLNVNIEKGKATALVGPNGCGKTTFIKSLLGFIKINTGNVSIFDNMVIHNGILNNTAIAKVRRDIGFISDN